jgi:predicted Fe-Mo cluster-binding NifX family protein
LKIAFPTDDGQTISAHFGRAQGFVVATVEANAEPQFEQRAKTFHGAHGEHDHEHEQHTHDHGGMFAPLADCQVLIAGGMGEGAQQAALSQDLEVILTGEKQIVRALAAYRAGDLKSDPRRLHRHGGSGSGSVKLEL